MFYFAKDSSFAKYEEGERVECCKTKQPLLISASSCAVSIFSTVSIFFAAPGANPVHFLSMLETLHFSSSFLKIEKRHCGFHPSMPHFTRWTHALVNACHINEVNSPCCKPATRWMKLVNATGGVNCLWYVSCWKSCTFLLISPGTSDTKWNLNGDKRTHDKCSLWMLISAFKIKDCHSPHCSSDEHWSMTGSSKM